MEDKFLLNCALLITFIGLAILLILSYCDKLPEKNFNDITSKDSGSTIKTQGTIKNIITHNNSMTLKLKSECELDVFVFEKETQNLKINDTIKVTGTAQEFNGKMELVATQITAIVKS
jgi:hypothetical protein